MSTETPIASSSVARVNQIEESNLERLLSNYLLRWTDRPGMVTLAVKSIHIVGSVLETSFTPGQSDLDVILGVDRNPHKDVRDYFWQSLAVNDLWHKRLEGVNFEFTNVDVVGVVQQDAVDDILSNPHHTLVAAESST